MANQRTAVVPKEPAQPSRTPRGKITPEQRAKVAAATAPTHLVASLTATEVQMVDDWRQLDASIKKMKKDMEAIKERLTQRLHDAGAIVGTFRNKPIVELVPWERQGYTVPPTSGETLKYMVKS